MRERATELKVGILIAAAFTLRAIQVSFFGNTGRAGPLDPPCHEANSPARPAIAPYPSITWPERAGALLLLGATIYLGLSPDTLLDWIRPALQSPAFHAILSGGAS